LSVINQHYPNLEYIIIDGASTDNSVEIIKKYEKHLAYFISEPDSGMTEALIKGFNKATGEIWAWLNSDDTYLPGTLELVGKRYQHTHFDFLYGDVWFTDINNKPFKREKSYYTNYISHALGLVNIKQPSSFWSKEIFFKVGGINPDFHVTMDGDLFYRILKHSRKTIRVNNPLSNFRIHPGQSGSWAPQGRYQQERKILFEREIKNVYYAKTYSYFFKAKSFLLRLFNIA
jgi:glycosyltransferase involved in cell wall biosynthesis